MSFVVNLVILLALVPICFSEVCRVPPFPKDTTLSYTCPIVLKQPDTTLACRSAVAINATLSTKLCGGIRINNNNLPSMALRKYLVGLGLGCEKRFLNKVGSDICILSNKEIPLSDGTSVVNRSLEYFSDTIMVLDNQTFIFEGSCPICPNIKRMDKLTVFPDPKYLSQLIRMWKDDEVVCHGFFYGEGEGMTTKNCFEKAEAFTFIQPLDELRSVVASSLVHVSKADAIETSATLTIQLDTHKRASLVLFKIKAKHFAPKDSPTKPVYPAHTHLILAKLPMTAKYLILADSSDKSTAFLGFGVGKISSTSLTPIMRFSLEGDGEFKDSDEGLPVYFRGAYKDSGEPNTNNYQTSATAAILIQPTKASSTATAMTQAYVVSFDSPAIAGFIAMNRFHIKVSASATNLEEMQSSTTTTTTTTSRP